MFSEAFYPEVIPPAYQHEEQHSDMYRTKYQLVCYDKKLQILFLQKLTALFLVQK